MTAMHYTIKPTGNMYVVIIYNMTMPYTVHNLFVFFQVMK